MGFKKEIIKNQKLERDRRIAILLCVAFCSVRGLGISERSPIYPVLPTLHNVLFLQFGLFFPILSVPNVMFGDFGKKPYLPYIAPHKIMSTFPKLALLRLGL